MIKTVPVGAWRPARLPGLRLAAVGLTLVTWASGCASTPHVDNGGNASSAVGSDPVSVGISCSMADVTAPPGPTSTTPSAQPLAADFIPVLARRCVFRFITVPGDGEWQVRDEQEATGGLDALARALRQPSETNPGNVACPAIGALPVVITLTDGHGRTIIPALPHDMCNLPSKAALQAIQAVPWKTVKETKVRQTRSQLEIGSGCPGGYKPMVAIEASDGTRRSAGTGPFFPGTPPTSLEVCRYRLDPAQTISGANRSGTFQMGILRTAATLTGTGLHTLLTALDAAGPVTGSCDKPQAPFAVLSASGGSGPWGVVELDGCYRATDSGGGLRQLDAATVAILAG
jgi:hypothetical protein